MFWLGKLSENNMFKAITKNKSEMKAISCKKKKEREKETKSQNKQCTHSVEALILRQFGPNLNMHQHCAAKENLNRAERTKKTILSWKTSKLWTRDLISLGELRKMVNSCCSCFLPPEQEEMAFNCAVKDSDYHQREEGFWLRLSKPWNGLPAREAGIS